MRAPGILVIAFSLNTAAAEQVTVRYPEGLVHGFLELQSMDGKALASGEMTQVARGDQVTSRLLFRFADGSTYDETATFSQSGAFKLVRDHLIQKGPAFKQSMDATIEAATGDVTVRYTDKNGKEKVEKQHLNLPADLVNGLTFTILKDIPPSVSKTTVSYLAATPKPRVVKLEITPEGADAFSAGNIHGSATHFRVKTQIGGVAGLVAPLIGKQPPDLHVWIVQGGAPAFIKFEGPLEGSGPIWRIQLARPPVFKSRNETGF